MYTLYLVVVIDLVGGVAQHAVQQRRLPRLQLLPDHLGRLVPQLGREENSLAAVVD